jgi:hypothetical protein
MPLDERSLAQAVPDSGKTKPIWARNLTTCSVSTVLRADHIALDLGG